MSFPGNKPEGRSPFGWGAAEFDFRPLFGRTASTEMVNSLTGWGRRNRTVGHHRRWVLSTSNRFVTVTRFTRSSAPTTAWRYRATGEAPALDGRTSTPSEPRDVATSLTVSPNSTSSAAASSRNAARSVSRRMFFPFVERNPRSAVPLDIDVPITVETDASLGFPHRWI